MLRKQDMVVLIFTALAATACGTAGQPVAREPAGLQLFTQMECGGCHVQGAGQIAPSLTGIYGGNVTLETGETVIADESYIRESILFPQAKVVQGYQPVMPSYQGRISTEQLRSLQEYIQSLGE